jgi:FlaA1/EpsC-like NDP-sugar epimerase
MARNYRSVVGITKFLSEAYLQEINSKDTRISVVRLPNVSWTPGSVHLIFERLINEDRPITVTHPEMSRRFIGGTFAANIILHALESGTHKGTLVVTSPPVRITDLAQSMIAEAGKDLPIEIIGVRPGEKLVEEGYDADEVSHTDMFGLSLLKEEANWEKDIGRAFDMLRSKPGCTIKSL